MALEMSPACHENSCVFADRKPQAWGFFNYLINIPNTVLKFYSYMYIYGMLLCNTAVSQRKEKNLAQISLYSIPVVL